MKNYLNCKFAYLLCFSVLLFGCSSREETTITEETQQKNIESILSEMKKIGDAEGKIVILELNDFNNKDYEKDYKLVENSKKVLTFAAGFDTSKASSGNAFKVTYVMVNGEAKITECSGETTLDCLENYKSSNINNVRMVYTPSL
ncbi:hypothetical protein KORDIASMS9_00012 [Kordia sp. SMS9]|uniref:hypothetical protein n=1 Tax=Kordia sp. SMS9 TaxID=2282170 RepID=UPI000E0D1174|nr:hypothetical protein [Kordia sp. SMS9]AXG67830.1 hypothetical protein KORDIASMS9_00012 [Kordia sp. SMS9]